MGNGEKPAIGSIAWQDLTVPDAATVSAFYAGVVGWEARADADCDGDYHMINPSSGAEVAGVCWARGTNARIPPQWLVYIVVEDVDASAGRCVALGGSLVDGPRGMGGGRFCVIQDPAGAVCALYAPA